MNPDQIESTAFYLPSLGTNVRKVLPFGITRALGAMGALMHHMLAKELQYSQIKVSLDDILVHTSTKEEHDPLLLAVRHRLEENSFQHKGAKYAIP